MKSFEIDYGTIHNQIISPTKVEWVGTEALNAAIQQLLQPSTKPYVTVERQKWSNVEEQRIYIGDKVIYTVNCYPLEVFNGETGVVTEFKDNGDITIDFGDKDIPKQKKSPGLNRAQVYGGLFLRRKPTNGVTDFLHHLTSRVPHHFDYRSFRLMLVDIGGCQVDGINLNSVPRPYADASITPSTTIC
jgi:hypothetical protein